MRIIKNANNKALKILLVATSITLIGCSEKDVSELDKDAFWASEVKKGGYYLHFRHGNRNRYTVPSSRTPETDVTGFDGISAALGLDEKNHSFGLVTCLTEEGIEEAKLVNEVFNHVGIQIQKVISSPSCRAKQTSLYAFGTEGDEIVNSLLHYTALPERLKKKASLILKSKILSHSVTPGQNIILSGHNGTLNEIIIDKNEVGNFDDRDDIGFTVIQKVNGELIARHTFKRFRDFSTQLVVYPLE